MGGMTGEIVFVMIIIGVVCIAAICMKQIREKESKLEEMEKKKLMEEIAQRDRETSLQKTLVSKVLEVTDSVTKVFMSEASAAERSEQSNLAEKTLTKTLNTSENKNLSRQGLQQGQALQGRSSQQAEDMDLDKLKEKLLQTEERLWEIESKEEYEKFFHKTAMPLQVLLGLAEVSLDTLTEERIVYYMWEVIANPLMKAVEQGNGKILNGKLVLSCSKNKFNMERVKRDIENLEKEDLENNIQKNERRLEAGMVVFQKVGVVQGLGGVLEELNGLERNGLVDEKVVRGLAQNVQRLLEENRIYPMFASDRRLVSYPELRKRYIPLNENSIRYPGLFIERDGELEVFGGNIGMDDCEL